MSKPGPYFEQHHAVEANAPTVSISQVMAAGLASVGAAVVTSRFGVAGTIFGAAVTTMIITGGSAVLKSYLETLSGHVKRSPEKIRAGRFRKQAGRPAAPDDTSVTPTRETPEGMAVYGRQRGGAGKLGSAFGWFSRLSSSAKRKVLLGAAIPAVLAFAIGMAAITGFEAVSGQPLSCSFGGNCQTAYSATGQSAPQTSIGRLTGGSSSSDATRDYPGQGVQTPADGGSNGSGLLDNIPGVPGNGDSVAPGDGQTPVYEQPSPPSGGGGVPPEEAPVEEVPTEEVPTAPVEPAVPGEQPSSGGVEAVPPQ